jgi:hypothetical protein
MPDERGGEKKQALGGEFVDFQMRKESFRYDARKEWA